MDGRKIPVPEDRHESEFAHYGQKILYDARPAEGPGGDAADADGLVYVLAQVRVERVLEQTRIAVVVLRHDEHESIGAHRYFRELRMLDRGAFVAQGEVKFAYVN